MIAPLQHIIIVGGGFGGIRAALNLANHRLFRVTLISDQNYFEYHAALYRSATGRSPLEVAIPHAEFFKHAKNVQVVRDKIVDFSTAKKTVTGESGSEWKYDVVIFSVGSVTNYFGIKGLEDYSYGVKSIHQALELKRHIHDSMVAGHEEHNYVVIGAGATGVELSAELGAYVKQVRRAHKLTAGYQIHLVESADKVLPQLDVKFTNRIQKRLKRLKIKLHLKTAIKSETHDGIQLPGGDEIASRTVVWTAGMTTNPLLSNSKQLAVSKRGKVVVDEFLGIGNGAFVIGDSAETTYSGMAQTAIHDANFVTGNLMRLAANKSLKSYRPAKPVYAIPVGPNWSGVKWGYLNIYGLAGWALRRLADFRLYVRFLSPAKALSLWRYGIQFEEECNICRQ